MISMPKKFISVIKYVLKIEQLFELWAYTKNFYRNSINQKLSHRN